MNLSEIARCSQANWYCLTVRTFDPQVNLWFSTQTSNSPSLPRTIGFILKPWYVQQVEVLTGAVRCFPKHHRVKVATLYCRRDTPGLLCPPLAHPTLTGLITIHSHGRYSLDRSWYFFLHCLLQTRAFFRYFIFFFGFRHRLVRLEPRIRVTACAGAGVAAVRWGRGFLIGRITLHITVKVSGRAARGDGYCDSALGAFRGSCRAGLFFWAASLLRSKLVHRDVEALVEVGRVGVEAVGATPVAVGASGCPEERQTVSATAVAETVDAAGAATESLAQQGVGGTWNEGGIHLAVDAGSASAVPSGVHQVQNIRVDQTAIRESCGVRAIFDVGVSVNAEASTAAITVMAVRPWLWGRSQGWWRTKRFRVARRGTVRRSSGRAHFRRASVVFLILVLRVLLLLLLLLLQQLLLVKLLEIAEVWPVVVVAKLRIEPLRLEVETGLRPHHPVLDRLVELVLAGAGEGRKKHPDVLLVIGITFISSLCYH